MSSVKTSAKVVSPAADLALVPVASYSGLRALTWDGNVLYASRGYGLLRAKIGVASRARDIKWEYRAQYRPPWWRNLSASWRLSFRLARDGFHALTVLSSGDLIAAVPGAVLRLQPQETEFLLSYKIARGTRPLHIAATPADHVFWGEYFDNPQRDEVHIYGSTDRGAHWNVAYTFARGKIRHVHNIIYDRWEDCLWIATGDNGGECRILRADCDLTSVQVVLSGNQQARAVALVPTEGGLYFSSDTPSEQNHVYRLDRRGNLATLAELSSSSIYGCSVGDTLFFSTMAEPSKINSEHTVLVYGGREGSVWNQRLLWRKDRWPMGLLQYGNAILPDGRNGTELLAITSVAVDPGDGETSIWHVC